MRYEAYIVSPEWDERRRVFFSTHLQACSVCGTGEAVQLHHLVYEPERFGSEPDEDLLPLCMTHHDGVHALHAAKADTLTLREATAEYVAAHGAALERGESKPTPSEP